jgi:hypothetical protein
MTGSKPSGLALDSKGRRLFVACEDGVIEIIDTDSGFTLRRTQGRQWSSERDLRMDPQGKGQWKAASFAAQQDGTLTGIRMSAYINYTVGGPVQTHARAWQRCLRLQDTSSLYHSEALWGTPVLIVAGLLIK